MAQVAELKKSKPGAADEDEPVRQSRSSCGTNTISLACRLRTACGLVVALWCLAVASLMPAAAAQPSPASFSDAVQVLAREQSAAEQYAAILIKFGSKDGAVFRKGIGLYTDARADFDGLIEALKADLILGRDPGKSSNLGEKLRLAAEKRIAFTSFVEDKVVGMGAIGILPVVLGVVPDLVKALTDAGISISKEYRSASKERRNEIRDLLDHLKWRAFAEISK